MSLNIVERASAALRWRWQHYQINRSIRSLNEQVQRDRPRSEGAPVYIFNASTRLSGLSLNAGFSHLTAASLKLSGVPVIHLACKSGVSRCILGTDKDKPDKEPPCAECCAQSEVLYKDEDVFWFEYNIDDALKTNLKTLNVGQLEIFTKDEVPLGQLVLPSLRWVLRRHHLIDDEDTRFLYRQFILSAWSIVQNFKNLIEVNPPRAVVVFNGMFYPEAAMRWVAKNSNSPVRVITHEVGLMPFTGYFTEGEATAYPIDIPDDFEMSDVQNQRLDAYLEQRFQGNFSMAGIRFWPEMSRIEPEFWQKAEKFEQIVPVFTNVIFDTSQDHANVLFPHMFAWLDDVLKMVKEHPETLFVLRAHPDESRPGKASRESVSDWAEKNQLRNIPNLHFVPPDEYFSSYELIQRSKFVMVYNSTIGLEATLLGAAVLCAGKARFTQIPTVFFPSTLEVYREQTQEFLANDKIEVPADFTRNARSFLYYQLFKTSLPFDHFLKDHSVWKGYVGLREFEVKDLLPENSATMQAILDGILNEGDFLLEE